MSKKSNSIVFMIVATIVNLILLIIFFIIGFVLLGLLSAKFPTLNEQAVAILMLLIFIAAIFGSFFVYSKLVKWATAKFNLEEKLDPIFVSKKNRIKKGE